MNSCKAFGQGKNISSCMAKIKKFKLNLSRAVRKINFQFPLTKVKVKLF